MPSNELGYSFAPSFENAEEARRGGSSSLTAQSPLKVLSFTLPKFKGAAGGLSPVQGTQMAGSSIGQAVLESVFRTVLGPDAGSLFDAISGAPPATPQTPAIPSPPSPSRTVVPGLVPTPTDTGAISDIVRGPDMPEVRPNPPAFEPPPRDPGPVAPPPGPPPAPVIRPGEGDDTPVTRTPGHDGGAREVVGAQPEPDPPRFRIPEYKRGVLDGSRLDRYDPFGWM